MSSKGDHKRFDRFDGIGSEYETRANWEYCKGELIVRATGEACSHALKVGYIMAHKGWTSAPSMQVVVEHLNSDKCQFEPEQTNLFLEALNASNHAGGQGLGDHESPASVRSSNQRKSLIYQERNKHESSADAHKMLNQLGKLNLDEYAAVVQMICEIGTESHQKNQAKLMKIMQKVVDPSSPVIGSLITIASKRHDHVGTQLVCELEKKYSRYSPQDVRQCKDDLENAVNSWNDHNGNWPPYETNLLSKRETYEMAVKQQDEPHQQNALGDSDFAFLVASALYSGSQTQFINVGQEVLKMFEEGETVSLEHVFDEARKVAKKLPSLRRSLSASKAESRSRHGAHAAAIVESQQSSLERLDRSRQHSESTHQRSSDAAQVQILSDRLREMERRMQQMQMQTDRSGTSADHKGMSPQRTYELKKQAASAQLRDQAENSMQRGSTEPRTGMSSSSPSAASRVCEHCSKAHELSNRYAKRYTHRSDECRFAGDYQAHSQSDRQDGHRARFDRQGHHNQYSGSSQDRRQESRFDQHQKSVRFGDQQDGSRSNRRDFSDRPDSSRFNQRHDGSRPDRQDAQVATRRTGSSQQSSRPANPSQAGFAIIGLEHPSDSDSGHEQGALARQESSYESDDSSKSSGASEYSYLARQTGEECALAIRVMDDSDDDDWPVGSTEPQVPVSFMPVQPTSESATDATARLTAPESLNPSTEQAMYGIFIGVSSETCSRTMTVDRNATIENVLHELKRIVAEDTVDGSTDVTFNYTHPDCCSKLWTSLSVKELVENDPPKAPFIFGLSNGLVVAHCTIKPFSSILDYHQKISESFEFLEQLMMQSRINLAKVQIYHKLVGNTEYSAVAGKVVGMLEQAANNGVLSIEELEAIATDESIRATTVTECLEAIRLTQGTGAMDLYGVDYGVSDCMRTEDHNVQTGLTGEFFAASQLRLDLVPSDVSSQDSNMCDVEIVTLDANSPFLNLASRLPNEPGLRALAPLLCQVNPPPAGLVHPSLNNVFVKIAESAEDVMNNLSVSDIKAFSDVFAEELYFKKIPDTGNCLYDAVRMGSLHCKNIDLRSAFTSYVTKNPDGLVGGHKARDAILNDTNGEFDLYRAADRSRFAEYNAFHGPNDTRNVYGSQVALQFLADTTGQPIFVMGLLHDASSEECSPIVLLKQVFLSLHESHDTVKEPIILLHGLAHPDPHRRTCHFDQDFKLQFGSDQLMCNGLHYDLLVREEFLLTEPSVSSRMVLPRWTEKFGVPDTLRCMSALSESQSLSSHQSDNADDFDSIVCSQLLTPEFIAWPLSSHLLDHAIDHATADVPVAAMAHTFSDSNSNSSSASSESDSDSSVFPKPTVVSASTISRQPYEPFMFQSDGLQSLDQSDEQPQAKSVDQFPGLMSDGDSESMTYCLNAPPHLQLALLSDRQFVSPVPEANDSDPDIACDQENDLAYVADDIHANSEQSGGFNIETSVPSPPSTSDVPLARITVAHFQPLPGNSENFFDSYALCDHDFDEHSASSNSASDADKISPQHVPVCTWSDSGVDILLDEVRSISNELSDLHEDMTIDSRTLDAISTFATTLAEQNVINHHRIDQALAREQSLEQELQRQTQRVKRHIHERILMILEKHQLEDKLEASNRELQECQRLLDSITTASEIDTAEQNRLVTENASLRAQCADLMAEVDRARAATMIAQAQCDSQKVLLQQMDERSQTTTTESSVQTVPSETQDSQRSRDELCVNCALHAREWRVRYTENPADVVSPTALRDDTPPCSACIRSALSGRRTIIAHNHCANDCYFLHPNKRVNTKGSSVAGSPKKSRNGPTLGSATILSQVRDPSFNSPRPGWKYVVHNGTQTTPESLTYISEVLSGFSRQHKDLLNMANHIKSIHAVRAMINKIFSARHVARVKNHLRLSVFIVHSWNRCADYSGVKRDVMRLTPPPFYNYVLQRRSFRRWTQLPQFVLVHRYDENVQMWTVFLAWRLSLFVTQKRKRSLCKRSLCAWASQSLRAPISSSRYDPGASGEPSLPNLFLSDSSFEGNDLLHLAELFPGSDTESIIVTNASDPDDVSTIVTNDPSMYPPHFESGTSTVTFSVRFGQQIHNATESFIHSAAPAYESLVERLSPHLQTLSATTQSVFKSVSARVSNFQTRFQRGGEDRDSDSASLASPTPTANDSPAGLLNC